MPIDRIGQPEVLDCLSEIWTHKHETARRLAQRIETVLDVAKAKGFRTGENPVTSILDGRVLPKVRTKVALHKAMRWQDIPAFYADLRTREAMAAKALMFTCLTGSRMGEVLGDPELDLIGDREKLAQWRHKGLGPAQYRLGRKIIYRGADLNAWAEASRVEPGRAARG